MPLHSSRRDGSGTRAASPSELEFDMMGGLRVRRRGSVVDLGSPKQRAVFAVLLLELDRVVAADRLVELLWGSGETGAMASLQVYISRLRGVLEPERRPREPASVLLTQSPGYRLDARREDVDLYRFEDAVTAGLRLVDTGDGDAGHAVLEDALASWTGVLLPELAAEPFVIDAARRVDGLRRSAVEAIGQLRLDAGDHRGAVAVLEPAALEEPGNERLAQLLALALYRSQRQSEALAVIARCRRALRDASGLTPGRELQQLEADVLAQASELDPPRATAASATSSGGSPAPAHAMNVARTDGPAPASLVGRSNELAAGETLIDAAMSGSGAALVVAGEPGIGKTTLAEAVVAAARERGFAAGWARCPEQGGTPPLWVLAQFERDLAEFGVDISTAVPDAPTSADRLDRFDVFRTVVDGVRASDRPTVLVVDDFQWADPDSLRLIGYLAGDLAHLRVLLVVTTRPLVDDSSTPVAVDTLADLARVPGSLQLVLEGLTATDVERWMNARVEQTVTSGVAEIVHERTGGNPLFVKEVTALLALEGCIDDEAVVRESRSIPPAVQFVVRRRVSRLDAATQRLLSVAAVVGRRFDPAVVADVAGIDAGAALDALGPAFDAGLLTTAGTEVAFSHVLVAEALSGEVNALRRASIHAAVARSMAQRVGDGFGVDAAAIAHHAIAGMLAGTGELAIEAGRRAAERATARLAHEDAAAHWADVAGAVSSTRPSDAVAHIAALLEQARSLLRADMALAAKEPVLAAIHAADAADRVDLMSEAAAVLNHSHVWTIQPYGSVNEPVVAALERTLDRIEDADVAQRAVIVGALPSELVFADRARHLAACERALAVARRAEDPVVLARALNNTMLLKRPDDLDERRLRAQEMLDLHERHELPSELVYVAHHRVAEVLLESGAPERAAAELDLARAALTSDPGSLLRNQYLWFASTLATATGRSNEAGRLAEEAYELHRRRRRYDADVLLLAHRAAAAIDRGGFEHVLQFASQASGVSAYQRSTAEAMAFGALEAGLVDLARSLVEPYGPDVGFGDDYMTLFCATAALHVRTELGDLDGAEPAAQLLVDYPDRWAGAGAAPLAVGFCGLATARFHALRAEVEPARTAYERAVGTAERAGAVAWLARSLVHLGTFLRSIDDGDAEAVLARARQLAGRHQFVYVQRRLDLLDA